MKGPTVLIAALVLGLAASPSSAQDNLLDAHVYLDVELRHPFNWKNAAGEPVYFFDKDLEQARKATRQAMVAHFSQLGVFGVSEGAENDFPRLLISAGCPPKSAERCNCDVGVTFTLLDAAGVLSESSALSYAKAEECPIKVELEPERLAPDLIAFLLKATVERNGFEILLEAIAGLEIAGQATPNVKDEANQWLLPKKHHHRLLDYKPMFTVAGTLDLPSQKAFNVPTYCKATYRGFSPNGQWWVKVGTEQKSCNETMSGLEPPFEAIDASVRMISFERIPSSLELLGGR